jgi:hypothetical protein
MSECAGCDAYLPTCPAHGWTWHCREHDKDADKCGCQARERAFPLKTLPPPDRARP